MAGWPEGVSSCYVLWIVTVVFSFVFLCKSVRQVDEANTQAELNQARVEWEKAKRISGSVFILCVISHFVSASWMGEEWITLAIMPCVAIGIALPALLCVLGDGKFKKRQQAGFRRQQPASHAGGGARGGGLMAATRKGKCFCFFFIASIIVVVLGYIFDGLVEVSALTALS